MANKDYINQAVVNAFGMLELFDENHTQYTSQEIADLLNISSSSGWRLVQTLEHIGYLKKQEDDRYSLGLKGLTLAKVILNSLDVRRVALPHVKELAEDLRLNVSLGILGDREVIYVLRIPSPEVPDTYFHVGRREPLYCTGLGKVLLAFQTKEKQDSIIAELEMTKLTENTITDKEELKEHLQEVFKNGYAFDREEHIENTSCLAMPIWNSLGKVEASISISDRKLFKKQNINLEEHLERLSLAADKISHSLGYGLYSPVQL
jgi:IclR family KDG regulon transcriptional repressor